MEINATEQIEKFQEFIQLTYEKKLQQIIRKGEKSISFDFSELIKFDPDLSDQLLQEPEETIRASELAIDNFDLPDKYPIKVRFFNLPSSQKIKIRNIRSNHLDTLIYIEGIVRQTSDVRPQVISAKFECPACGNMITVPQLEATFKEPSRCSCGRRGKFRLVTRELVDSQRVVIEEAPEALEGGEQPKRMSIFLRDDLVDPKMEKRTTPGSKVGIVGIVKEVAVLSKTGGQSTRFDLMILANHIEPIEETFEDITLDEEDVKKIKDLAKDPEVNKKLIGSIAPSVYGHEDVKEALLLQMMGGVRKERKDGTFVRGDLHILLVGDPGAAKSTLLTYMSKAALKARYVAGRSVSGAGITAAVVRDEFLRGWALEAGAIVLANKGLLCLDEMDKMSEEDTSALHEGMAQQTISVSKANIQATLRCETSILAAANPKLGRFDPYTPIAAQIDLPPALINRFDLIFPIRDLPNVDKDTKIASHVLESHQNVDVQEPTLPIPFLKKYVSYTKQKVFPKLTDGAKEEIMEFYVNLRNSGQSGNDEIKPIPISARQLEALVRLAEGNARIRLSSTITKQDAKVAINILRRCLMAVGIDYETGKIDIDRISTGITATQRNKIVIIREIISKLEAKGLKTIPLEQIIMEATDKGIDESKVEEVIEKMKKDGMIFEPKRGFIQKI